MLNTPFSPWPSYSAEEADAVAEVLRSNRVNYWTGDLCREFETCFAAWAETAHAVALANGTVALDVALKALGIGPGDEVISGYVTRRPFILEVQDLWPDSVAASGMNGTSRLARLLDPVCRFVYRRASLVLGQSHGMAKRLVERGVSEQKADVMFNWANESAARANGVYDLGSLNFNGRFNFVYGGNLGAVQGLDSLVRAAHSISETTPQIQLTLIGDGLERERLAALIEKLGAKNVRILPSVPQSQIGDILAAADVLVTHLKNDPLFEITIPSKTQFYMAMGKPVLVGVRGESARIVTAAGAGMAMEPDNEEAIAEAFRTMASMPRDKLDQMGAQARAAYDEQFSFASSMSRLVGHIGKVTSPLPASNEAKRA